MSAPVDWFLEHDEWLEFQRVTLQGRACRGPPSRPISPRPRPRSAGGSISCLREMPERYGEASCSSSVAGGWRCGSP